MIVLVILIGLTAIRNLSIFVKFNTYSVGFVIMILTFIVAVGVYSFTNTEFIFSNSAVGDHTIKLYNSNFAPLMGILGGGYYLHNITLPIIKNAKNPEKNVRDVFLGYLLVFLSYTICGTLGYFGFSGTYFTDTMNEHEIQSNCLLMFSSTNVLAIIIRFCVFCQILASMSLMFACQRSQIFLVIYGTQSQQPLRTTIIANILILIMPFLLAVFYP